MSVKIDNLNEFSNEIPEKVKKTINTNKDKMKITTDKKYLITSFFSKLMSRKKCLLIKTFFGLTCDIKSFIENLNKAYNFINLMPELVEKKEPPIITKIKNINERFWVGWSNETPILDILLVNIFFSNKK